MCPNLRHVAAVLWAAGLWTPALTWMLLTRRIGNAQRMLPAAWLDRPRPNVWLGATVVNQEKAEGECT